MELTQDERAFLDEIYGESEPVLGISINKHNDLVSIANDICAPGFAYGTYYTLVGMVSKAEETQSLVEEEINGINVVAYPVIEF